MTLVFTILFIALGGSIGAAARYICQRCAATMTSLPGWVAIMVVNVVGSLIIGFCVAWLTDEIKAIHLSDLSVLQKTQETIAFNELMALLAVGFCGAFTTFSTFSLDNFFLSIDKKGQMLINMIGTTVLAFIAVFLGWHLGQMVST